MIGLNSEQNRQVQSNTQQVFGYTNLKHQGVNQTSADSELLRKAFVQSPQLMYELIQAELYGRIQQQQQIKNQKSPVRRVFRSKRQAPAQDSVWSAKKIVDSIWPSQERRKSQENLNNNQAKQQTSSAV